jgi:carboxypeptidase C (cathepsin A)
MPMKLALTAVSTLALLASPALSAAPTAAAPVPAAAAPDKKPAPDRLFQAQAVTTSGTVTVGGKPIAYDAVAGNLVVHGPGWDDTAWREAAASGADNKDVPPAEASMFYAAYFKKGAPAAGRPIMFLFNGGPGSATVWLHMGAFGPKRVVTAEQAHTPAAPYDLVSNAYSLLDVADLVFIDAPGAGFSRIAGKDKEKAFWGVDNDAAAFESFIKQFLTKYSRWNSPKYLFGESYGTPRAAVLVNRLQDNSGVDFNGVVMLSQILNFDMSIDTPDFNPGTDVAYITGLPTMAATAWYHNRLAGTRPADLETFLKDAENFALTDYAAALQQGSLLDAAKKRAIAERLSGYIGLPADYILKSNLRINGGQFEQQLQIGSELTTGRLDTRFSGPAMDVLEKQADYDPQSSALSSAYVSAFNHYARTELKYGEDQGFKLFAEINGRWDFGHRQPGRSNPFRGATNVMPDLAQAMKQNPNLKVLVTGGYYDLATPYYQGVYEMHHLPIPDSLQKNIEYKYYPSGHMVYAIESSLKGIHDTVADFVGRTDNVAGQ